MATCKQCRAFEKCKDDAFINGAKFDPNESAKYCTGFEPITNADRIRAMSDEELAKFIASAAIAGCPEQGRDCRESCAICFLEWLKQSAEEGR